MTRSELLRECRYHRRRGTTAIIRDKLQAKEYVGSFHLMPSYHYQCLREFQQELVALRKKRAAGISF